KGYKPSSIRYLLASVPYRHQLNFTFDGLQQAAASVERLRNFRQRLTEKNFAEGSDAAVAKLAEEARQRITAPLADDLNTAQATAAVFDMVRSANGAIDSGAMKKDDAAGLLSALDKFDEIFAVLKDDDLPKMQSIADWAKAERREVSAEVAEMLKSGALS